ncbi:MAG: nitroreductase family protein [bacterium]|nr:nitroreductase family protein [bacterium]
MEVVKMVARHKKTNLLRRCYEKGCSLLGIIPRGRRGAFDVISRPSKDIPYFISANPKVNPYDKIPKSILKAHMRLISHFLTRKLEKYYFKGIEIKEDIQDYLQVKERLDFLKEQKVNMEVEPDLKGLLEINKLYEKFVSQKEIEIYPPDKPFNKDEIELFDRIIKTRRSVRCWKNEPVSREIIESIIESAIWAPSTGNMQSVRYIVIDDEKVKQQILVGGIKGAPIIVSVAVDIRVYPSASTGNKNQDAAAAIQNFLLKTHILGLGAVWISGKTVNSNEIRRLLNFHEYIENIAFVYLGWPANRPITPPRSNIKEVLCYNKYSEDIKIY